MKSTKTRAWVPALLGMIVLAGVFVAVAGATAEATTVQEIVGSSPARRHHLKAAAPRPPGGEEILVDTPTSENDALVRYMYDSMRTWTNLPESEEDDINDAAVHALHVAHEDSRARQAETASDIVFVAREDRRPLFPGDGLRDQTAVLVAGVAFFESGYSGFVDRGDCNDHSWRHPSLTGPDAVTPEEFKKRKTLLATSGCDGGWAYSDWQIHPFDYAWREGIVLLDDDRAWMFSADVRDGEEHEIIAGKDMIADRRQAARVALHMLRRALGPTGQGNLCGYTGERGYCPKAEARLQFAKDWSRRHPFVPAVKE